MNQKNDQEKLPDPEQEIEIIARAVHESWMRQRRQEGWTYADEYSHEKKTTPSMKDYGDLPESEKEIDRATVRQVIDTLTALGYQIRR